MIRAKQRISSIRNVIRPYQRVAATGTSAVISYVIPKRLDPVLTSVVTRCFLTALPMRRTFVADRMAVQLDDVDRATLLDAADRFWLQRVETRWGGARGTTRRGWSPSVELIGIEHIVTAKEKGRGVILWRLSSHSAIPLNLALSNSGHAPVHLSRQDHLLRACNDRLWQRIRPQAAAFVRRGEERLLAERVEMTGRGTSAAMKRLMTVLGENAVVTIVGDLPSGRKRHRVQVNATQLEFANGGARLAVKTGAALLPVLVHRVGPMQYRIEVKKPLIAPDEARSDAAVESLIEQLGEILGSWLRHDPAHWPKWRAALS